MIELSSNNLLSFDLIRSIVLLLFRSLIRIALRSTEISQVICCNRKAALGKYFSQLVYYSVQAGMA